MVFGETFKTEPLLGLEPIKVVWADAGEIPRASKSAALNNVDLVFTISLTSP